MATRTVTVNDLLVGHVGLDVECLDRVYLNLYVPNVQVPGQVVLFLRRLGFPIPSPAVVEKIGDRFRAEVSRFCTANGVPMVRFAKGDRKVEVMRPHLERQAATGRSGVAAVGVAQESQKVATCTTRASSTGGAPQFSWGKADRRVTCYYFYLWDDDFGPAFIKICAYFPYPGKVWVNGHEWAKRQATKAGIAFTAFDHGRGNGFASCEDPAGLQQICDRLGPGTVNVFLARWWARLPSPLTAADRAVGYWWEASMRQVEVSKTLVFDQPRDPAAVLSSSHDPDMSSCREDSRRQAGTLHQRCASSGHAGPSPGGLPWRSSTLLPIRLLVLFALDDAQGYPHLGRKHHYPARPVHHRAGHPPAAPDLTGGNISLRRGPARGGPPSCPV